MPDSNDYTGDVSPGGEPDRRTHVHGVRGWPARRGVPTTGSAERGATGPRVHAR